MHGLVIVHVWEEPRVLLRNLQVLDRLREILCSRILIFLHESVAFLIIGVA